MYTLLFPLKRLFVNEHSDAGSFLFLFFWFAVMPFVIFCYLFSIVSYLSIIFAVQVSLYLQFAMNFILILSLTNELDWCCLSRHIVNLCLIPNAHLQT